MSRVRHQIAKLLLAAFFNSEKDSIKTKWRWDSKLKPTNWIPLTTQSYFSPHLSSGSSVTIRFFRFDFQGQDWNPGRLVN